MTMMSNFKGFFGCLYRYTHPYCKCLDQGGLVYILTLITVHIHRRANYLECLAYNFRAGGFKPDIPLVLARALGCHRLCELYHLPNVLEITHEPQTDPDDPQFSPHYVFKVLQGYAGV